MKRLKQLRTFLILMLGMVASTLGMGPAMAVDIQQFTTPAGIKVYLVENYTTPLVTISFSFASGATQDPTGKEGVTRLLSSMLDEGAGGIKSQQFQAKAERLGMEMSFSASRDYFTGSMQTLVENSEESFKMLQLALNQPRFDATPMERMRQSMLKGLERAKTNPQSIASKAMRQALFEGHPYKRSKSGSIEGLKNVKRDDLVAIHNKIFVKKGLVIGVVGAIDQAALAPVIDAVFAGLPEDSQLQPVAEAKLEFGKKIDKDLDIPQSIISFALPGLKRSDPDFFAGYLANHILGGGTFSSRLYNEVREERGLAYSVYSHIATYSHAAFTLVGSATSTKQVEQAIDVIRAELKKMADQGPTEAELEAAKKYIIGSYAIRNLDTSIKVAGVLVAIQQIDLGIDYIDRRADIINAVKLEDVKRVAAKLLQHEPTLIIVGPKETKS